MKSKLIRHWQHALVALFLLGAATTANAQATPQANVLGPGDLVRISVFGQPELGTLARVAEDGSITFPLIGSVQLGGLTINAAERRIANQLQTQGYVRNAQVTLFVEERSSGSTDKVTILGKVSRPGSYPLQDISIQGVRSVVDILAAAGGTTNDAGDTIFLLRKQGEEQQRLEIDLIQLLERGDLGLDVTLEAGDVVLVPRTEVFYIYGQVENPGRYPLSRDLTVMQALSVAGGVTRIGNERGIILRRRTSGGIREFDVDITNEVEPDDVIYVKERRF